MLCAVHPPQGIKVMFIAAGSAAVHCIAGDANGVCYTWGRNEVGGVCVCGGGGQLQGVLEKGGCFGCIV
jgi:hypothetical protein